MNNPARKRRPSKADIILADPVIARSLASDKALRRSQDIRLLTALVKRLDGRRPRKLAPRLQRFTSIIYRDPLFIVQRFLRRHTRDPWHQGGSHIARLHFGPGIGFRNFRNDRRRKIQPILLNAEPPRIPTDPIHPHEP